MRLPSRTGVKRRRAANRRPPPRGRPAARRRRGNSTRPAATKRLSIEHRRARALLIVSALFAVVVVSTGVPVAALLAQRHQLASTSAQLSELRAENRSLTDQARELNDPAAVSALARGDYGMVPPGDKAYDILPAPGSPASAGEGSGHVPLDGPPVVPGSSQSQELLGVDPGTVTDASGQGSSGTRPAGAAARGGFWSRVIHNLEFWN